MTKKIKMLKPGQFKDMNGKIVNLTAEHLQATAAAYDPTVYACPLVVGHPKVDSPSYGKLGSVDFTDNILNGTPGKIAPEFVGAVNGGYYDRVSLSLFEPTAPANPVPGVYYPRHLGFLGAAAPAVPGLGTVSFAAEEEGIVSLSIDMGDWNDRTIARMFRSLKNFLVEQFGKDKADKVLDEWDLESVTEDALRPEPVTDENQLGPAFAETKGGGMDPKLKEELDRRKNELDEREAALRTKETAGMHTANVSFADELVKEGKLLASKKDEAIAALDFAAGVTSGDTIEFGEGDTKQSKSPLDLVKGILSSYPKVVEFAELAGDEFSGNEQNPIPADLSKHV